MHEENPSFAKELLDYSLNLLKDLISQGNLHRLKLLLRFYSSLVSLNYLPKNSLEQLLISFIEFSASETSEFFSILVASTLLHYGGIFSSNLVQKFLEVARRARDPDLKSVFKVFTHQNEDILEGYIKSLCCCQEVGFQLPKVLSIQQPIEQPIEYSFPIDIEVSNKCRYFSDMLFDVFGQSTNINSFILQTELLLENLASFKMNLELTAQKFENFQDHEILLNTILSELMSLNFNETEPVLYSSLMVKLSRPPVSTSIEVKLVEAVEKIMIDIENVNSLSLEKLYVFLAYYISNMSFCWNWSFFVERTLNSKQEMFLRKLLGKLVRLSYHDMVKAELPESLCAYLLPEPEAILRFTEIEESVDNTDSQLIIDRINSKAPTQAMKALLTSKEICNSGDLLMMIFCESLFYQGSKSLQHITIYLERYMEILTGVSANRLLNSLANVWTRSPQRIELIIGKLLGYKLINSEDLCNFCLERVTKPDSWQDFHTLEWDLLELAVSEAKEQKLEILELICQSVSSIQSDMYYDKLLTFLRKFHKVVDTSQVSSLESSLPAPVAKSLRKLVELR